MELATGLHLGYCTNIHRGETWPETLAALETHTLEVRRRVAPDSAYGIGLRLSDLASRELAAPEALDRFRAWLAAHDAYVFTINGFPYGQFHGGRVKEQVYAPDWTTRERIDYTCRLFDILAVISPPNLSASISSLPGSFKTFISDDSQIDRIIDHLITCSRHVDALRQRHGRDFHLGLEPEPLGLFETSEETARFFERLFKRSGNSETLREIIGVNYDTCHLAVEFESAPAALDRLANAGIRLSKLHLSSALDLEPTAEARRALAHFAEDTYLHQVVVHDGKRVSHRFHDLPPALEWADSTRQPGVSWRVHFHIPLHATPDPPFRSTRDHLEAALDWLQRDPAACRHLEMETYTWEVLPPELHDASVEDQLVREYEWTLESLRKRQLA